MKGNVLLRSFLISIFLGCFMAACFLSPEPYHPVRYFDLGTAETSLSGPLIEPFGIEGPYRFRMVYRSGENELLFDEYSKWLQAPDKLLVNYLRMKFIQNDAADIRCDGTIHVFEADLDKQMAVLTVSLRFRNESGETLESFTRSYREVLADKQAKSFAEAMRLAAEQLAADISRETQNLKKKTGES